MSKKNNRKTRANAHAFKLAKEKEEEAKRQKKQQKQQEVAAQEAAAAAGVAGGRLGVKKSGKKGIKVKAKPIRLKKNKVVRGMKIKDAESRRRAKELLAAEEAIRQMEMGSASPKSKSKKLQRISFATGEAMDAD